MSGSPLTVSQKEASKHNMADLVIVESSDLEWKLQLKNNRPRLPPFKIAKSTDSDDRVHSCHSQGRLALKDKGRVAPASAQEPAEGICLAFQKAARSIPSLYRTSHCHEKSRFEGQQV